MWGGGGWWEDGERSVRQKREKNRCDAVMLLVGGAGRGGAGGGRGKWPLMLSLLVPTQMTLSEGC